MSEFAIHPGDMSDNEPVIFGGGLDDFLNSLIIDDEDIDGAGESDVTNNDEFFISCKIEKKQPDTKKDDQKDNSEYNVDLFALPTQMQPVQQMQSKPMIEKKSSSEFDSSLFQVIDTSAKYAGDIAAAVQSYTGQL